MAGGANTGARNRALALERLISGPTQPKSLRRNRHLLTPPFPDICLSHLAKLVNNDVNQLSIFLFRLYHVHVDDSLVIVIPKAGVVILKPE